MFNFFKRSNSTQPQQQQQASIPAPQAENFYSTNVKLRDRFAEELFYLEMEVEQENVTMETVTQLLNLYKEAVEYFEAIQSNKFVIFKNKIQNLFTKKNVIMAMKMNALQNSPTTAKMVGEQKQSELRIKLKYISQQEQKSQVNDLINQHSLKSEKINTIINKDLEGQSDNFQKRLQQRQNSLKRDQQPLILSERGTPTIKQPIEFNTQHTPQVRTQNKQYRGRINYQQE